MTDKGPHRKYAHKWEWYCNEDTSEKVIVEKGNLLDGIKKKIKNKKKKKKDKNKKKKFNEEEE